MIPVEQKWSPEAAARYRAKGYWRGETFGRWLTERAASFPDRVAIVDVSGPRYTYGELNAAATDAARGFLEQGLARGDRVVVHMPNVAEFFAVIFGLFKAGMIPVYALAAHRLTEIEHFARTSEASGYVIAAASDGFDYRGLARELCGRVPAMKHVVVTGGDAGPYTGWDDLLARGRASELVPQEGAPSEVAFMQISGGSTGLSKLIPRTHDDYIYTLRESDRICNVTDKSVFLCALPVAHNFPMSSPGTLGALYAGGKVVLSPSPAPEAAFPLIERERVTITGLVPPLLLVWLEAAATASSDLSSLEVIGVGGAKLTPEIARRVEPVLHTRLQQVFGMAEGLVNYTRLDDPDDVVMGTQGRPISPDDEILIVDDKGDPVPDGEAGYLLTRGPYTIHAYHNNPSANARSFTEDGYYRTGDRVVRTPEGYLVVQGRAGDHINRAGEKISAEEIEDHLLAHPNVFDATVVSVPDTYLGERSCAFIIPRGNRPRGIEIKRWMRERGVADFKVPDQVVFVDHFAETAAGKTSRKELRAALRARLIAEEQQQAKASLPHQEHADASPDRTSQSHD